MTNTNTLIPAIEVTHAIRGYAVMTLQASYWYRRAYQRTEDPNARPRILTNDEEHALRRAQRYDVRAWEFMSKLTHPTDKKDASALYTRLYGFWRDSGFDKQLFNDLVDTYEPPKEVTDSEIESLHAAKVAAEEQAFEESYDQQQDEREAQDFFDTYGVDFGGTCPDCGRTDIGCTCEVPVMRLTPAEEGILAARGEAHDAEDPHPLSAESPRYSAISARETITIEDAQFFVWRLHWSDDFVEYDVYEPTHGKIWGSSHSSFTRTEDGYLWGGLVSFYPYQRFEHLPAGTLELVANNQSWYAMRYAVADQIAMLAFPHDFQEGYTCEKGKRIASILD